jgi:hypothetical protein
MTQREQVIEALSKNFTSISDIFESTNIPKPSIRRVLFQLRKENIVSKPVKTGLVKIIEEKYYRKMISSLHYCSGKKKVFTGITFELTKSPKRKKELLLAIEEEAESKCSDSKSNHGYSNKLTDEFKEDFIYPEVDVFEN